MLTNLFFKSIGSGITRSGKNARLSILIYHRVLPDPDPMLDDEIDAKDFSLQMDALAASFNVLPLGEAVKCLKEGSLPPRAACITFDDGYANNATTALKILNDRSLSACFFIATEFLDGSCMWNDIVIEALRQTSETRLDLDDIGLAQMSLENHAERLAAKSKLLPGLKKLNPEQRGAAVDTIVDRAGVSRPRGMMMTPDQVRTLANAGMEIGAHTVSHPILATLDDADARHEMAGSKERLEDITQQPVTLFAYPNGRPGIDFTAAHASIAKELGFRAAVTTENGTSRMNTDPFLLPRFTPWDRTPGRFTLRLYQNALVNRAAGLPA